jgi:hypothetical protein
MLSRARLRFLIALTVAISSVAVIVGPATAETILVNCNGTCGYYQYGDTGPTGGKGAVCKYETGSYDLDFISVRPPLMHGPFPTNTPVAWKYKIYRRPVGGAWSVLYTSTWQSSTANDAIPAYANHGFERRYWYAPESPTGNFKVRVYLRWKNGGGTVIGTASAEYDWYQRLWNGSTSVGMEYCIQDW